MTELEAEFGSEYPIGVAKGVLYDREGKEIVVPLCEICRGPKILCVGKDSYCFVCSTCRNFDGPEEAI